MDTLVIGDVHGNFPRLEALLKQEGIIGLCPRCNGEGDDPLRLEDTNGGSVAMRCSSCDAEGIKRINYDVEVIQLGDLGHFGSEWVGPPRGGHWVPGSPSADLLCWDAAKKGWIDKVLWGNHDASVAYDAHTFNGALPPAPETKQIMGFMAENSRLLLAASVHGFLLTHAGLHKQFKYQKDLPTEEIKTNPVVCATWLNGLQAQDNLGRLDYDDPETQSFLAIRDCVGKIRGGKADCGGILWRDATEKIYPEFRQVFGHSKGEKVRKYHTPKGWSYCVDVGAPKNGRLAAIWLPDERIVEVNLNANT